MHSCKKSKGLFISNPSFQKNQKRRIGEISAGQIQEYRMLLTLDPSGSAALKTDMILKLLHRLGHTSGNPCQ